MGAETEQWRKAAETVVTRCTVPAIIDSDYPRFSDAFYSDLKCVIGSGFV
jgi:hypothetical protein